MSEVGDLVVMLAVLFEGEERRAVVLRRIAHDVGPCIARAADTGHSTVVPRS